MEGLSRQGTTTRRLPLPPGENLNFFGLVFFPVFLRVLKFLKEDENENESKRNEKKRKTKRDETRRNRVRNQKKNRNRNRNRKKGEKEPVDHVPRSQVISPSNPTPQYFQAGRTLPTASSRTCALIWTSVSCWTW